MSHDGDEIQLFPHGTKVYVVNYDDLSITPGIYIPHVQKGSVFAHYVYSIEDLNTIIKHTHLLHLKRPFRDYVFETYPKATAALRNDQQKIIVECNKKIDIIDKNNREYFNKIRQENLNIDLDVERYFSDKDKEYIKTIQESFKKLDVLEEQYLRIVIKLVNDSCFKYYEDFRQLFIQRITRYGNRFLDKYTFISTRPDKEKIYNNIIFMINSIAYEINQELESK